MGFNTKSSSAKNEKAAMTPGEKVEAKFVSAEVNDKGDLIFLFQNDSGSLKQTEFNIDPTHQNYVEEYADSQMSRIKHIACAFLDEEEVDKCEGETYKAWAAQLVEVLKPTFGTACTLKVVVNKKNYASLPLFANFISSEKTPLSWTTTQYDKYTFDARTPDREEDTDARGEVEDDDDVF